MLVVTFQEQFPNSREIPPQTCIITFAVAQGNKMTQSCSSVYGWAELNEGVSPQLSLGHTLQVTEQEWAAVAGFARFLDTMNPLQATAALSSHLCFNSCMFTYVLPFEQHWIWQTLANATKLFNQGTPHRNPSISSNHIKIIRCLPWKIALLLGSWDWC